MFITLHPNPNQTMSLQHMLEMGSLFSNPCTSPFYYVRGHFVEHLYTDAGSRRRNSVL
jgi:hypothetical protein